MLQSRSRATQMFLIGWPLLSVLANTGRAGRWLDEGNSIAAVLGEMTLWAVLGMLLAAGLWFPWRRWMADAPLTGWRLFGLLALCLILGVVHGGILRASEWPIHVVPPPGRTPRSLWAPSFVPAVAMFSWVAVHYLLQTFDRLGRERERTLQAEALATEARLAMLRNELNPHFLFNALNSIIGVISENPPRAQQMVRQLAGLLRHTLNGPKESTLGAEIEIARKYLSIEEVRFEERLQVEVNVADDLLGLAVPAMLLQPLVENTIKHGMGAGRLTVRIEAGLVADALEVRIVNVGTLGGPSGGVGLRNLRDRLALHPAGGHFGIEQEGELVVATITLPRTAR